MIAGRVSASDAAGLRLYQCGPGDALRPVGVLETEKVASMAADEPCRTLVLTPSTRRWLEQQRPELVLKLYGYLLAGRFKVEPE